MRGEPTTNADPATSGGASSSDGIRADVSLATAFGTWCRVAALSFGGPAGQIAVMHRILVEEKKWIGEERFLHALNCCQLLPGPEAQQLATYIGWLMHGPRGGVLAGTLFVLPGFLSILVLSMLYIRFQQTELLLAVFFGLQPAVIAIVAEAVFRIGRRVLKNRTKIALAAISFVAIFFVGIPFPLLIVLAGLAGYFGGRRGLAAAGVVEPSVQSVGRNNTPAGSSTAGRVVGGHWRHSLLVTAICLPLWFGPLIAFWWALGGDSVLVQEGLFFSQAALVTFGGAYSVLAYVAQRAVEDHRWLSPGEMQDGLGMAETTPGPLIMVVQFVGYLGAYRNPGPFTPAVAGILGSVVTTWVTFVPCFYWIFLGAPYFERIRTHQPLTNALAAISAAVVGAVLNLAVWFALHTLFGSVSVVDIGGLTVQAPDWRSFDPASGAIAAVALVLIFLAKRGIGVTLVTCVGLGIAHHWLKAALAD